MGKKFAYSYLFIVAALLLSFGLTKKNSDKLRGETAAFLAPVWEKILQAKHKIVHPLRPVPSLPELSLEEINQSLAFENQRLLQELAYLSEQLSKIPFKSHIPARVIFRTADSWNHSLWINAGENDGIALHSPVVTDDALIGMIDYVGKKQARVRLITDPRLILSVRALRGNELEVMLAEQAELLTNLLKRKNREDHAPLLAQLEDLKNKHQSAKKTWYLAKGEIQGGPNHTLKGTGFNYDFEDEKGGPYDLREGIPLPKQGTAIPLVKVHDLLVTTGMDGLFPEGLKVAKVDRILPLKEGDYFFELEATPLSSHLQGLSLVFVLPPSDLNVQEVKNFKSR